MNVWLAPVMSGISAALSLVAVLMVAGMNSRNERRKWLREERVRSVVELKLAVAQLRVRYSSLAKQVAGQAIRDDLFDFSDVNTAMARVELVGASAVGSEVEALRRQLRDFVQASAGSDQQWRVRRDALDATIDRIVDLTRGELV